MIIELSKEDIQKCGQWGLQRTTENQMKRDIADYDHRRFHLTSLQNNRLAVAAEYAVLKYMGLPEDDLSVWASFVEQKDYKQYLGQPDILGKIEVRRADKKTNPIPIRTKDVKDGAFIVHAHVAYTWQPDTRKVTPLGTVELIGWADAAEDWVKCPVASYSNGDTRSLHDKRSMDTLDLKGMAQQYLNEHVEAF